MSDNNTAVEKPRVEVTTDIPEEKRTFDPNWEMIYDTRKKTMTRNMYGIAQQVALTGDQVAEITQIINDYEQRIHELESRVAQMEKDNKIATTNKPDAPKKSPGRPKKQEGGEDS